MKGTFSQFNGAGLILLQLVCLAFAGEESTSPKAVNITELKVPFSIENGTEKYVTLDCIYELAENNTEALVINWYLNFTESVYQWIYGKTPQSLGILRNRLDLDYKASTVPYEMHRALRIIQPTTELSGDYRCQVNNIDGSAIKDARMIVFVPPKDLDIRFEPSFSPNTINVTCSASGVFPEPKITLSFGTTKDSSRKLDQGADEKTTSVDADGAFDISVHKVIHESNLTSPTHFNCELKIPNTSYVNTTGFIYKGSTMDSINSEYEGSGSMLGQPCWFNGLLILIILYGVLT